MGTIVLHAGSPKAGSSTIQTWLARNAQALRDRHDVGIVVARNRVVANEPRRLVVEPYVSGGINSGAFVFAYLVFKRNPHTLDVLFGGLDRLAGEQRVTIVSSEGFAQLLASGDEQFLARLDELAHTHEVRIAYYFRPQHTCLEAMWRQWGYRLPEPPSVYLGAEAERLHYLRTRDVVARLAPRVTCEMRPFRHDLLIGESPVVDFAEHFLDAGPFARETPHERVNVGLPLALVNVLRVGPPELVGVDEHDNVAMTRLQALFDGVAVPTTAKLEHSRRVLTTYCHARFEAENQALLGALGVPATEFVPPDDLGDAALELLDELWVPEASPSELALLHRALCAAIERG